VEQTAGEIGAAAGYLADFSSLHEVRRLAEQVEGVDVLVNNAGLVSPEREESQDGYELGFAVNYLAGFALTGLLLPRIEGRIVNVASIGQHAIDFSDVMLHRSYDGYRSYAQSKLAQIMFTIELAERLGDGAPTVNALHPATLMDTKMVRESFGRTQDSVDDGVRSVVRLVADPELDGVSGRFFDKTSESRADRQAYDEAARTRLWKLSEELTGVSYPSGA
jgi:NAD(P)-dependent dehydrogenase (short-subunit alcohol dehydrogenase family)